jgi:ADP-ribose pyrophosphatase YjhB (NUDIX family)
VTHYGCYALVIRGQRLLCVRKTRGPYEGLGDLPGGAPEPGESPEQTLRRELLEETGGREISSGPWHDFSLNVDRDSKGAPIQFLHEGKWRLSELEAIREDLPAAEDVAGLAWIEIASADRASLSALALHVLRQAGRI